jgi:hypothetical protein
MPPGRPGCTAASIRNKRGRLTTRRVVCPIPSPATASAEEGQFNGAPFPATAWAEGPQLNAAPFPATASAEGRQLNVAPSLRERVRCPQG